MAKQAYFLDSKAKKSIIAQLFRACWLCHSTVSNLI